MVAVVIVLASFPLARWYHRNKLTEFHVTISRVNARLNDMEDVAD